jgi:hypothetical protein
MAMPAPAAKTFIQAGDDPNVTKVYVVGKVPVGDWIAELQIIFNETGRTGLTRIVISFDPDKVTFRALSDEIKAKYGPPTSANKSNSVAVEIEDAKWVFPHTQVYCVFVRTSNMRPTISLVYSKHTSIVDARSRSPLPTDVPLATRLTTRMVVGTPLQPD